MPDTLHYDVNQQRLHFGIGFVDHVPPAVRSYEVSGKQVLLQWFSEEQGKKEEKIFG